MRSSILLMAVLFAACSYTGNRDTKADGNVAGATVSATTTPRPWQAATGRPPHGPLGYQRQSAQETEL